MSSDYNCKAKRLFQPFLLTRNYFPAAVNAYLLFSFTKKLSANY